jgi:hypothetical protein
MDIYLTLGCIKTNLGLSFSDTDQSLDLVRQIQSLCEVASNKVSLIETTLALALFPQRNRGHKIYTPTLSIVNLHQPFGHHLCDLLVWSVF